MSRDGSYFVIVNQCEGPKFGCAEEFGPLVRVNADQMARDGLDMILCSVELYPKRRKTEKSELEALPRAEQAKFDCEHKHVSLSLRENELWLAPMHVGKRGGRIGGDMSETQVVRLPATPEAFFQSLQKALELAD